MGPITKLWINAETKLSILSVIQTSQQQGVSARRCCSILMIEHRRVVRWQQRAHQGQGLGDRVPGPKEPLHRILPEEVARIVAMAKSQEYVDLSHRILAVTACDKGLFQASFSTVYRVLKDEGLMTARQSTDNVIEIFVVPVRQGPHGCTVMRCMKKLFFGGLRWSDVGD